MLVATVWTLNVTDVPLAKSCWTPIIMSPKNILNGALTTFYFGCIYNICSKTNYTSLSFSYSIQYSPKYNLDTNCARCINRNGWH